jgi:acetolactate synthase I/II/III large subunit
MGMELNGMHGGVDCREALETEGPYLLDIMVPHIEHVLPMIPGGGGFKDVITTGDGTTLY